MFEILFSGTSAAAPSEQRGFSALIVKHNQTRFLIDCGEEIQLPHLAEALQYRPKIMMG